MSVQNQSPSRGPQEIGMEMLLRAAVHEAGAASAPPDVTESVLSRLEQAPAAEARRGVRWATAALLLLGLGATAWIASNVANQAERQAIGEDPSPQDQGFQNPAAELPPPQLVEELAAAMPGVRNLRLTLPLSTLPDLDGIGRLERLERLVIATGSPLNVALAQQVPEESGFAADVLAPLAACPQLHTLEIRGVSGWGAAQLGALREVKTLRRLVVAGAGIRFDAAFAGAVAALPSLRALHLEEVAITTAGVRVLAEAATLSALTLQITRIEDSAVMQQIASIGSLRELALPGIDLTVFRALAGPGPQAEGALLTPQFLAALPELRRLDLSSNPLDADQLGSLPRSLRSLRLESLATAGAAAGAALIGLPELDDLSISFNTGAQRPGDEMLTELLSNKELRRLQLADPTPAAQRALGRQVSLEELVVTITTVTKADAPPCSFDYLASLPQLRELTLHLVNTDAVARMNEVDVMPLAKLTALQRLVLRGWNPADVDRVRALVDAAVVVRR